MLSPYLIKRDFTRNSLSGFVPIPMLCGKAEKRVAQKVAGRELSLLEIGLAINGALSGRVCQVTAPESFLKRFTVGYGLFLQSQQCG